MLGLEADAARGDDDGLAMAEFAVEKAAGPDLGLQYQAPPYKGPAGGMQVQSKPGSDPDNPQALGTSFAGVSLLNEFPVLSIT